MLHKILPWTIALFVVSLAGCADSAVPTTDHGENYDDFELEATEDTGVIRGVVVDESIVPIAGASIVIESVGLEATTNAEGLFGFKDLDPGFYTLSVDAEGYQAVQTQANVEAGVSDPPAVRVSLLLDPSELPFANPLQFNGYLDCSFSTPAYRVAACGITNPGGVFQDNFLGEHHDQDIAATWIQAEMVWKSTQPAGDAMMFTMEDSASDGGHIGDDAQGESPLVIVADHERMTNDETNPYKGYIMHRVFNMEHPMTTPPVPVCGIPNPIHGGTMCAKGVGATIQQSFTIYTHVFSNAVPKDGWQFSVDGEPELRSPPS